MSKFDITKGDVVVIRGFRSLSAYDRSGDLIDNPDVGTVVKEYEYHVVVEGNNFSWTFHKEDILGYFLGENDE